jgi:hypothetical protein
MKNIGITVMISWVMQFDSCQGPVVTLVAAGPG